MNSLPAALVSARQDDDDLGIADRSAVLGQGNKGLSASIRCISVQVSANTGLRLRTSVKSLNRRIEVPSISMSASSETLALAS